MPLYNVKMMIEFQGEIEADSEADAQDKSWTAWSDNLDSEITYAGVYSIDVDEIEEDEEDEIDDSFPMSLEYDEEY